MGVWEVRLQARAIYGGEQAGGRLSGGGELRRGEGGRERLLRYHRGGVANLERFRGNANLTSALGAAARQTVEASFSLRATVPKIAEILLSAAALRRPSRRKLARSSFKPDLARSAASNDVAPSR